MPDYVLPLVRVFQEFEEAPTSIVRPLPACIVGENYRLFRFSVASEKSLAGLGAYDPLLDTCYDWPSRPAGAFVDQGYTRLFADNTKLRYFSDPGGGSGGSVIKAVEGFKNRIRSDTVNWKTNGAFVRNAALLRDVKAGDAVRVTGDNCGSPATFDATVIGLVADRVASIIGAIAPVAGNAANQGLTSSHSHVAGTVNNVDIVSIDASVYNGLPDGDINEIYYLEVITGGIPAAAVFRLTSQSGNDNNSALGAAGFGSSLEVGSRGLIVVFNHSGSTAGPDNVFIVGQKWQVNVGQAFTVPVPADSGAYTGPSDTKYIITVSRGGKFADSPKPQIRVATSTGIDLSGPTLVSASAVYVPVGSYGVLAKFTGTALRKGDQFTIDVTAEADGPVRTLVLDSNLPDGFRGQCGTPESSEAGLPDLGVDLYLVRSGLEITAVQPQAFPAVNWSQDALQICLEAGVTVQDPEWVNAGVLVPLPLISGDLFVQYRARLSTYCGQVGELSDDSAVAAILGPVVPDNPLAFGVHYALLNSGGQTVKFVAVCGSVAGDPPTLDDWEAALDSLTERTDVYTLVPLTFDKAIHDAFEAHVVAESSPDNGRWRVARFCRQVDQTQAQYVAVAGGGPILATIEDNPDLAGVQNTIVTAVAAAFVGNVRAGDTVRYGYSVDDLGRPTYATAVVDAVISNQTLRLLSGPLSPVVVASKIEVWRTLTADELATFLATLPGVYDNRRTRLGFPDVVGNAGVQFPGYFLDCAYAGLRSGVLPHQGLTNVALVGFDDMSRTDMFTTAQLNRMAASGYWITKKDRNTGKVYSRHQLTTDMTSVLTREESLVSNPDSVSYLLKDLVTDLIGLANVTPKLLEIINIREHTLLQQLTDTITVPRLGPQLISAEITLLERSPTAKDGIENIIRGEFPAPLNEMNIHLRIR